MDFNELMVEMFLTLSTLGIVFGLLGLLALLWEFYNL